MTPQEFVAKWRQSELKERSGYQEHFIDLCRLLGHATPAELDPTGRDFAFEAGVSKAGDAYDWPHDLSDDAILARLLAQP